MELVCQTSVLNDLSVFAEGKQHSILIEGVSGSGKTYLARRYAELLAIPDFQIIEPTVQLIRDAIDSCSLLDTPIVLCIENLDLGVSAASYTLLKFLEEPKQNIYIVVTCRNANMIPDTIVSRSVCTITSPPIPSDLEKFAVSEDATRYQLVQIKNPTLWKCVRTFSDVQTVLRMSSDNLDYFNQLANLSQFNDTIANMSWQLGHYPDNSETPLELVIRNLMELHPNDTHIQKAGIDCIRNLSSARIASHAVIARFLFEVKYCE